MRIISKEKTFFFKERINTCLYNFGIYCKNFTKNVRERSKKMNNSLKNKINEREKEREKQHNAIRDVTIRVCLSFIFAEIFFFAKSKKGIFRRCGCHYETKLTHTRKHTHKFTSQFNKISKDEIFLVWFMSVVVVFFFLGSKTNKKSKEDV